MIFIYTVVDFDTGFSFSSSFWGSSDASCRSYFCKVALLCLSPQPPATVVSCVLLQDISQQSLLCPPLHEDEGQEIN